LCPAAGQKHIAFFKKAAELGSDAAKITKKEMERRGLDKTDTTNSIALGKEHPNNKSAQSVPNDTGFSLMFIDFHTDTSSTIADTTLIRESYQGIDTLSNTLTAGNASTANLDSNIQSLLSHVARSGNPEALCLLGRCYEHGLNIRRDIMLAGVYYLRALHLDSYRAPALLWKLMNTEEFARELEMRSSKNDPDALYIWSGLTSIGFSKMLNEKQAFDLLQRAAAAGHVPGNG
jgi:hypothetical protein